MIQDDSELHTKTIRS